MTGSGLEVIFRYAYSKNKYSALTYRLRNHLYEIYKYLNFFKSVKGAFEGMCAASIAVLGPNPSSQHKG